MQPEKSEYRPVKKYSSPTQSPADPELFQRLRQLRLELSKSGGIPPYAVFTDATLQEMCVRKPKNRQELMAIPGVGERKLERYGTLFLKEIHRKK